MLITCQNGMGFPRHPFHRFTKTTNKWFCQMTPSILLDHLNSEEVCPFQFWQTMPVKQFSDESKHRLATGDGCLYLLESSDKSRPPTCDCCGDEHDSTATWITCTSSRTHMFHERWSQPVTGNGRDTTAVCAQSSSHPTGFLLLFNFMFLPGTSLCDGPSKYRTLNPK